MLLAQPSYGGILSESVQTVWKSTTWWMGWWVSIRFVLEQKRIRGTRLSEYQYVGEWVGG